MMFFSFWYLGYIAVLSASDRVEAPGRHGHVKGWRVVEEYGWLNPICQAFHLSLSLSFPFSPSPLTHFLPSPSLFLIPSFVCLSLLSLFVLLSSFSFFSYFPSAAATSVLLSHQHPLHGFGSDLFLSLFLTHMSNAAHMSFFPRNECLNAPGMCAWLSECRAGPASSNLHDRIYYKSPCFKYSSALDQFQHAPQVWCII